MILRHWATDAVWEAPHLAFGDFVGRAAIRELWEEYLGAWEEFTLEADEVRDWARVSCFP